jgi:hypothetical protein
MYSSTNGDVYIFPSFHERQQKLNSDSRSDTRRNILPPLAYALGLRERIVCHQPGIREWVILELSVNKIFSSVKNETKKV